MHPIRAIWRPAQVKMQRFDALILFVVLLLAAAPMPALATATPAEAAQLKTTLTPMGAERAGNARGTIPSWTGGYTSSEFSTRSGAVRPDPFASEKPLFSITAANASAYANALPEGALQLFKRYDDYRMDIYPTHRSAAAPQSVYESVFRNATRAHAAREGINYGVEGASGGVPFPVPHNGYEVVWNHLLAYWGPARKLHLKTYVVEPNGTIDLTASYSEIADFPFYYPDATPQSYGGYYFKTRHLLDGPPGKVGEGYLDWQPINTARYKFAAWRLLPGERRARRGPSLSYDIPDPDASGYQNQDEYYVFFGGPDRYDFKIIGKKELYVPYNNNRLYQLPTSAILAPKHARPDSLRYELHRVWVIEGTLAAGKHHIAPRRRLYIDEDTWLAVYGESWDENGKLWKFAQATMYLMPDVPAVVIGSQFVYDFDLGGYVFAFAFNDEPNSYTVTPPHAAALFTPEALAAQAVR
jgi:hypothetical protein